MEFKRQPTFETIIRRASALGLPIAEFAFEGTKRNPVPNPPFLVYLKEEHAHGHDSGNALIEIEGSLELYTERKPAKTWEQRIERDVLYDVEYDKQQAKIESERIVQTAYDFTITQKG